MKVFQSGVSVQRTPMACGAAYSVALHLSLTAAFIVLLCGCGEGERRPSETATRLVAVPEAEEQRPSGLTGAGENLRSRTVGEDWPRFLNATFDGKSAERGIRTDWSAEGLPVVWSMPVGTSYGIGAVAEGRYFQHERVDDVERLRAVNAESGEPLWQDDLPVEYSDMFGYNNGPRDTPAVDGDDVVTFGVAGRLTCRDVRDGRVKWTVETSREYGVVQNFFGVGSSALIHDDKVIVMVGGSPPEDAALPPGRLDRVSPAGSALVAFDRTSGRELWKAGDDLASYSSPRLMTIEDESVVLAFAREGLLAVRADSGEVLWHYPHRARTLESVNAMVPVVEGNRILISECYEVGSVLLEATLDGVREVWKDPRNRRLQALRAHWATPILVGSRLLGSSGRNEPDSDLRCVEWDTGKVLWNDNRRSRCSLLAVDGHLVVLDESGLLQLIRADADRLQVVAEMDLDRPQRGQPSLGRPYWAAPILSHGLLYVRGSDRVLCLELIPEGTK